MLPDRGAPGLAGQQRAERFRQKTRLGRLARPLAPLKDDELRRMCGSGSQRKSEPQPQWCKGRREDAEPASLWRFNGSKHLLFP